MGSIIYYALHQSPAHAIHKRKMLLAHYLRLNVEKQTFTVKTAAETADRYGTPRMAPTAWWLTDAENKNYWFNPGKYGIPEDLPADTRIRIKVYGGKVVKARLA